MNALNSRRDGFALAAAVLAMLVVGAIVTGGFYAASQEGQISKSTDAADMALYIAETGLNTTIGSATATTLGGYALPSTNNFATNTVVAFGGRNVGTYTTRIYRISQALYFVASVGTVTLAGPYSGATRVVAQVLRLKKADFDNDTAFQVFGDLAVGGTSDVDGNDTYLAGWTGCTTKTGTSAVTANPASDVGTQGSGTITGTVTRQTLDSTNFKVFGDMTYAEVAGMANFTFADGTSVNPVSAYVGTVCTTSNTENWGNPILPTDPCYTWYPIIHATGDLHITSSGYGQGILLVDGDLNLTGGFTFYGAVVVLGTVRTTGTGGHINGSLFAYGGGDLGSSSFAAGNSLVQYSSCAIDRAVLGTSRLARGYPIANRSWVDISAAQNAY